MRVGKMPAGERRRQWRATKPWRIPGRRSPRSALPLVSPPPPSDPIKDVTIYTDGACSGNPGPGGWGATLVYGTPPDTVTRDLKGAEPETTNNRMELTAAAEAMEALREPCRVRLHSDSAYLINAFNDRWLDGWQRRGWKKADKSPVLNRDLWERLLAQNARHDVTWVKVKGHNGVPLNEHVDGLAVGAMRTMMAERAG